MFILGFKTNPGLASNSTNRNPFVGWNMFAEALLFIVHAVSRPISVPAVAQTSSPSGIKPASVAIKTASKHTKVPGEINSNVFATMSSDVVFLKCNRIEKVGPNRGMVPRTTSTPNSFSLTLFSSVMLRGTRSRRFFCHSSLRALSSGIFSNRSAFMAFTSQNIPCGQVTQMILRFFICWAAFTALSPVTDATTRYSSGCWASFRVFRTSWVFTGPGRSKTFKQFSLNQVSVSCGLKIIAYAPIFLLYIGGWEVAQSNSNQRGRSQLKVHLAIDSI